MRRAVVLAVLMICGCDSGSHTAEPAAASKIERVIPADISPYQTQSDCEKAGGQWRAYCAPSTPSCLMPYSDAGKQCNDPSECESKMCLADTVAVCKTGKGCVEPHIPKTGERALGICRRTDARCGSFIEIKKGIAQEPYNID